MNKLIGLFAAATIAALVSGCDTAGQSAVDGTCWSDKTKAEATANFKSYVADAVFNAYANAASAHGRTATDDDKKKLTDGITVTLSDFYIESMDKDAHSYQCAATAIAQMGAGNQSLKTNPHSAKFSIYTGEKKTFISAATDDAQALVDEFNSLSQQN